MRLTRQIGLSSLVLAALAIPVLAQAEAFGGIGRMLETIFGGVFNAISTNPAVWMKVILASILWIILYVLVGKAILKDASKGAKVMLSLAIAIGATAPIPNALITELFGALGFVGVLFYIAPVLGVVYWTRSMVKDAKERHPYIMALLLWLLTWLVYINGLGTSIAKSPDIRYIGTAQGLLNLVAIGYIIYYISMMFGSRAGETPRAIAKEKERLAGLEKATRTPARTRIQGWRRQLATAIGGLGDVQRAIPPPGSHADLPDHQPRLKAALGTFNGYIITLRDDRNLVEILNNLNASLVTQLNGYLTDIGPVTTALNSAASIRARSPADLQNMHDRLIAYFQAGGLLNRLLSRIDQDLDALTR